MAVYDATDVPDWPTLAAFSFSDGDQVTLASSYTGNADTWTIANNLTVLPASGGTTITLAGNGVVAINPTGGKTVAFGSLGTEIFIKNTAGTGTPLDIGDIVNFASDGTYTFMQVRVECSSFVSSTFGVKCDIGVSPSAAMTVSFTNCQSNYHTGDVANSDGFYFRGGSTTPDETNKIRATLTNCSATGNQDEDITWHGNEEITVIGGTWRRFTGASTTAKTAFCSVKDATITMPADGTALGGSIGDIAAEVGKGTLSFIDCTITTNYIAAETDEIFNIGDSSIVLCKNCTINDNGAGAVCATTGGTLVLWDCTYTRTTAVDVAQLFNGRLNMYRNKFDFSAMDNNGLTTYFYASSSSHVMEFHGNEVLAGISDGGADTVRVLGFLAAADGGSVTHNTFIGNKGNATGNHRGIFMQAGAEVDVWANVFYDLDVGIEQGSDTEYTSRATSGLNAFEDVANVVSGGATGAVRYSDIGADTTTGNIVFEDAANGDYRLAAASAGLNADPRPSYQMPPFTVKAVAHGVGYGMAEAETPSADRGADHLHLGAYSDPNGPLGMMMDADIRNPKHIHLWSEHPVQRIRGR
jgi:hypothetical protein